VEPCKHAQLKRVYHKHRQWQIVIMKKIDSSVANP